MRKKSNAAAKPRKGYKPRVRRTKRRSLRTNPYSDFSHNKQTNAMISKNPFPEKYYCKLYYDEQITFTTGTAGVFGTENTFLMNSLYDPNYTGVGHQPLGYDQLTGIYKRYKVNFVDVKLTFTDPSADGVIVAAQLQSNANALGVTGNSPQVIAERPMAIVKYVNNTGRQVSVIRIKQPVYRCLGLSKLEFAANPTVYGSTYDANPSNLSYLRISAASVQGTAGVTVQCMVQIIYYAELYDRMFQAPS